MSKGKWKNHVKVKDRVKSEPLNVNIQSDVKYLPTAIETENNQKVKSKRGVPGNNFNPNGRPRRPEIELVRQAIEETSRVKKKSLWLHLVEKAYDSDAVLIALARKFLPDKMENEGMREVVRTVLVRADQINFISDSKNQSKIEQMEHLNPSNLGEVMADNDVENAKSDPVDESKTS